MPPDHHAALEVRPATGWRPTDAALRGLARLLLDVAARQRQLGEQSAPPATNRQESARVVPG